MIKLQKLLIPVVALILVVLANPVLAADSGVTIRRIDAHNFPRVDLVISTRGLEGLTSEDLTVTEDGSAVESVDVQHLTSTGVTVDVVLVIDHSGSMEGAAMAAANAAAAKFIETLPAEVRVGAVTFSDRPTVLTKITTDHQAALEAVSGLTASGETSMNDGIIKATKLFSGEAQRNMILLSDGGDTTSKASFAQALAAAKKSRAVVFPVGLETTETDVRALKKLARGTGGRYASAAEADLTSVYQGLAEELKNQFVLTYRSGVAPGQEATIGVQAAGTSDSSLFLTPARQVREEGAEHNTQTASGFRPGLLFVLPFVFLCFVVAFRLVIVQRGKAKRQRRLRTQLGSEIASQQNQTEDATGLSAYIPNAVSTAAERFAEETRLADRVDRLLERAGVSMKLGEFMAAIAMSAVAFGIFALVFFSSGPGGIFFFAVLGALTPMVWMTFKARLRANKIKNQLADVLGILASSMRVGHSFLQALDSVAKEIGEPASHEFSRAVAEVRLGRSTEDALNDLSDRVGSEDFKWAVLAANIQRDMGGNLAEVLDTVAATVRGRENSRRQIDALSAEGRYSAVILTALPFFLGLYMYVVNPEALGLLFTTSLGRVFVTGGSILLVAGVVWMRKLVRIDV